MPDLSMIQAIAATGFNGELGMRGTIPWQGKLPRDMKHFMQTTKGSAIIMGRVTADTMKLPLKTRSSIIVTTKKNEALERYGHHSHVASSLQEAIESANAMVSNGQASGIFIIGGAQIYALAMEMGLIDIMHLTTVHGNFRSDASFSFDRTHYELVSSETHPPDESNSYGCTFDVYEKK